MAISRGDRRVARAVNALLAIGSDAELAHGLQPFDESDEIFLARRFRPFPQPSERRAVFVRQRRRASASSPAIVSGDKPSTRLL